MEDLKRIIRKIKRDDVKKKKIAKDIGITDVYLSYMLNSKRPLTKNMKEKLFERLNLK